VVPIHDWDTKKNPALWARIQTGFNRMKKTDTDFLWAWIAI
jgi:hypothetical protein